MTQKHHLAHSILRRWNYCLPAWPLKVKTEKKSEGFIETGFKGIYAGYRGDVCGELDDTRKKTRLMPTLSSLLKIDSTELKELLLDGISKQTADLVKFKHLNSERGFNSLCKELETELSHANKLKPESVEKDFAKKKYVA